MRNALVWVAAVSALVGVELKHAAAQAAWCNTDGLKNKVSWGGGMDSVLDKDWSLALPAIMKATCWPEEEHKKRKQEVDAARAAWSKTLGLTDADWKDVAEWTVDATALRLFDHLIKPGPEDAKLTLGGLLPVQQLAVEIRGIPGMSSYGNNYADIHYHADALGPKLTETGRLGFIWKCSEPKSSAAELAICESDIKALDRKKIPDEIRSDTNVDASARMMARLILLELDKRLVEYNAAVKQWKAKDPAYAKMFEIAAATRKEWQDTHWKNETALLELALAMDDVRISKSRKAKEGCSEKTWAAWKAAVSRIPASKFVGFSTDHLAKPAWAASAFSVILSTAPGYLAAVALYSCHKEQREEDPTIEALGYMLTYQPGLRGPRLATLWAMRGANLQLDDENAKLDIPEIRHDTSNRFYGEYNHSDFTTVATIGKPGANGLAKLTFAKTSIKQERCTKSRMTNRISHITDNGTVIYWNECLTWGTVSVDQTRNPVDLLARYVDGVKPGMGVVYADAQKGNAAGIFAVFPKGKKAPTFVFGAPVK